MSTFEREEQSARPRADRLAWIAILLYLLALVAPAVTFFSVARYAVNVPVWDEWEFPLLMSRIDAGELTVPELAWLQRGEHRKVFPHLIILALARMTSYNVVAHIYLAIVLRVLALGLIWRLLAATVAPARAPVTAALTLVSSLLLFSAAEYENWIWGESAIMVALINLAIVTMVWALHRWPARWPGLVVALLAATVAAFSAASGLLLWGVGLVGLVLYGRQSGRGWLDRRVLVWILCAVALTLLYFAGWARRFQTDVVLEPGAEMLTHHLAFSASYLGAPLELREALGWAAGVGILGLVMILDALGAALRGGGWKSAGRVTPWFLLILFVVATAGLTSIGRSGFGLEQASRYIGISALFWVGAVALVVPQKLGRRRRGLAVAGACVLVAILLLAYGSAYARGYDQLTERSRSLREKTVYLRHVESARHQLRGLYPKPELLRPRVAALEALELGVFDDPTRREGRRIFSEPAVAAKEPALLTAGREYFLDLAPGFSPDEVAWHLAVVGGEGREVIFMIPPAAAEWTLTLPAASGIVLTTGLVVSSRLPTRGDADAGWGDKPPPGDGVRFRLSVERMDGSSAELLSRWVDPWRREEDRRFVPVSIDLDAYAGETIVVRLTTDPGPSGDTEWDLSGWVSPRVSIEGF